LQPAENRSYNLLEVPDVAVDGGGATISTSGLPFWDSSTASLATYSWRFLSFKNEVSSGDIAAATGGISKYILQGACLIL
jgi:hypothetical protein